MKMKLGVLFSGGKDSTYAAWLAGRSHCIACLITLKSKNKESYMFHTANIDLAKIQAELMNIPLLERQTKGIKEDELKDIEKILEEAKKKYQINGVVTGALASEYQKSRIEAIGKKLGLECISPLWHSDPEATLRKMAKDGFEIIITAVAAGGLDKSWLGRKLDEKAINELLKINEKMRIHIMGEGGEFETMVTNCPLYSKKIIVEDSHALWDDKTRSGELVIKKVKLTEKH